MTENLVLPVGLQLFFCFSFCASFSINLFFYCFFAFYFSCSFFDVYIFCFNLYTYLNDRQLITLFLSTWYFQVVVVFIMEKNETNWNGLTNWYKELKFAYELGFNLTAARKWIVNVNSVIATPRRYFGILFS